MSDLRSSEMVASMKTRRALEWKAWLENPRSINATMRRQVSQGKDRSVSRMRLTLHLCAKPRERPRK